MILLNSSQKMISRTKYYVIDINLANEQILVNLSSEENTINFANLKNIMGEKILKAFIPCSRSLFKPTEHLMELVYMIRIFLIFKARWLLYIDFILDRPIQQSVFHIHLIYFEIMVSSIDK
jgi:hypothetical protein